MSPCIWCSSPEGTTPAQMARKYVCNMLGQLSISSSLLPPSHLSTSLHIPEASIIHKQPFCLFCEPASEQDILNPNHWQSKRCLTYPKPCSSPSWSRWQLILLFLYPAISCMNLSCWKRQEMSQGEHSASHDFRPQSTLVNGFVRVCYHCLSRKWPKKLARVITS